MLYEKFRILVSCYDWRIGELKLPRSTMYAFVKRMEEREKLVHLKLPHPLGVKFYISFIHDHRLASKAFSGPIGRCKTGLPHCNYIHTISVHDQSLVVVTWFAPEGSPVDSRDLPGEVVEAKLIPVENCKGVILSDPDIKECEEVGKRLWVLARMPRVHIRCKLLPFLIAAALDIKPMLSLTGIKRALQLLDEDESLELKARYILRYYRELSSNHVVGRVFTWTHIRGIPFTLEAPIDCAEVVYGFLASTMRGANIYLAGDAVYASIVVGEELIPGIRRLLSACPKARLRPRVATLVYQTPYEMLDPITGEWRDKPVEDYARLLAKLRLATRA